MLRVIRSLLLKIVDNIDAGNSNISEGEALEIVDSLKRFTDKEKRLSKYAACEYLNVSRATFDNYVREGKLPRGKHEIGFEEVCKRYRGVIPASITACDVYVAINSQYHDYSSLFKTWFMDGIEQKIIESAMTYWFADDDCKSENKVVKYFK